jgi:ectoine hydroxylase-related dioxygenase (phytanoyl-CoA dioxygenase family)
MKYTIIGVSVLLVVAMVVAVAVYVLTRPTLGAVLSRDGVVHIRNSFSSATRHRVLSTAFQELGNCDGRKRGDINNSSNRRFEVAMPLTARVKSIVRDAWVRYRDVWTSYIGCTDPRVVECSAMITFPGAQDQEWHRDNSYDPAEARLLSIGIALQDITSAMGPLEVVKGTHTTTKDVSDDMEERFGEKMTCSRDDIVAWVSSVHHRGSGNSSNEPRVVMLFTVASDGPLPDGSTYALLKKYKDGRRFRRVSELFGGK